MEEQSITKEKILKAAKLEFLSKGYEKASLRKICADADVTTGAMYFFFKNKQDLFANIVSEKSEKFFALVDRQTNAEVNGIGNSQQYQREMNEYLCENKDIMCILLEKSDGTPYEDFAEKYCSMVAQGFFAYYDKNGGLEEYRDIMKLIVRMRIQGYVEMLKGDYDMDKMMKFSALMEIYGDCGFAGMMEQFNRVVKGVE